MRWNENELNNQEESFKKALNQIIEELRFKEIIVRDGGFQVEIKNIVGKGRDEINISEIPFYLDDSVLSKELCSQITEWCVQKTRSGEYTIKIF